MATWTRVSGTPITVEREVRVCDPETGREGYVSVSWSDGHPSYGGVVKHYDRVYDRDGCEVKEPRVTVLDADPAFA